MTKLKGNRSRPWLAKVTIYDEQGHAKQTPIGYAETEEKANILLAEYNNNPWDIDREKVTLVVLYQRWSEIKLPKLGKSNQQSLRSAFKHCSKYYGVKYRSLKSYQMQDCIDNCGCGYSTQWSIKNLFGHLDRFAFEIDLIDKMYSQITTAPPIPDTTREPFTPEQVDALWKIKDDPWVNTVLIYIYTGFRLQELLDISLKISGIGSYVNFILFFNMFNVFFISSNSCNLYTYLFDINFPIILENTKIKNNIKYLTICILIYLVLSIFSIIFI